MAELFKDHKLLRNDPESSNELDVQEALGGKVVALYFSAHWCPPCRGFTPVLKAFYQQANANSTSLAEQPFEIVFVSYDQNDEELKKYLEEAHGKWCYVPYGDPFIQTLSEKYEVTGIPDLLVIQSDGTVIERDGRNKVQDPPAQITPSDQIAEWKSGKPAEPAPAAEEKTENPPDDEVVT